jgi:hypothetical protein
MRVVPLESPLKDINRYMFLIFLFQYWILKQLQSSELLHAKLNPTSCLFGSRITGCIEPCLSIGWHTVIWWKNPPKWRSILVLIAEWCNSLLTSRNPKNNWCLSRIYGARFGEKDLGLSTACKPWSEQAGGLEDFLHLAAHNFEVLSNIQDQK